MNIDGNLDKSDFNTESLTSIPSGLIEGRKWPQPVWGPLLRSLNPRCESRQRGHVFGRSKMRAKSAMHKSGLHRAADSEISEKKQPVAVP